MSVEHKVVKIELNKDTMDTDLESVIDEGSSAGWSLVSITPITSGKQDTDVWSDGGYGWGYGYTSHLLVTFKRAGLY
jgi:hypothetical protein